MPRRWSLEDVSPVKYILFLIAYNKEKYVDKNHSAPILVILSNIRFLLFVWHFLNALEFCSSLPDIKIHSDFAQ